MASEDRAASNTLIERLERAPFKFHFFQAVRQLECAHGDLPRVGQSLRPSDDPVHFSQEPSLAFAPSTIRSYHPRTQSRPARLEVSFMGLLGPHGPLPLHLTEYARDRQLNHADPTFARFLDIFNHRMVCLYYRAWAYNQQAVSYDRPEEDRFGDYIGSLCGLGTEPLRKRDAVPDAQKLHFAGRLSCPTRHAEGLQAILGDDFGVDVEIDQFIGHWVTLPQDSVCILGKSEWTGTLGSTAVLGSQIWDCQQKFRIRLGPLSYTDYQRMLPGTGSFKRLVAWVRNYVGDELLWDLHLILKAAEVPKIALGQFGELGWSTWVSSESFEENVVSVVSNPLAS